MSPESFEQIINRRLIEGADLRSDFARASTERVHRAAVVLADCLGRGNKVLVLGNGGSAADAQHFAAEFVGRFGRERDPLPVVALTTDSSVLTAVGNDYGFKEIFVRQVRALASPGDAVVAISTSGRSPNVLQAVGAARALGAITIALTGGDGGELAKVSDIGIVVPSSSTHQIQEVHVTILHILSELIESSLFAVEGSLADLPKGVVGWSDLLRLRNRWMREKRIVAWSNGCFDILHVGHLHCLEQAKRFGDILVVGVNTDAAVRELKGPGRPVFPVEERMRLVAGLVPTDYVVEFEGLTPEAALLELKPDVHVKGDDYAPPSGKPMPERRIIESYGGRIEFIPLLPEFSSTAAIENLQQDPERG
jgi:D-sedoheptulose 7-phosphate isomerase